MTTNILACPIPWVKEPGKYSPCCGKRLRHNFTTQQLWIFHCLDIKWFIYLPTEGHLGCFWVLSVMNKTAINICVQVLVFGYLIRRADSFEKTLMLGKIEGRRRRGWQRMRCLDGNHRLNGHGFGWTPGVGNGQGGLPCCGSWGCKESDMTERLNWTE